MSRSFVLLIYNLLLPVFFLIAFPAWLVKMWKRGGYGSGLMERLGRFQRSGSLEPKGVVYVHAVSVGEVLIALKLIDAWLLRFPAEKIVLAATTSTGHQTARGKAPEGARVIYSPLDFCFVTRKVLRRFEPKKIVLVEAETWPNLLNEARRMGIPVAMVNVRLSQRSEARFQKFSALIQPIFAMVDLYCVQNEGDRERFVRLGVPAEKIRTTGSIKFDPAGGAEPRRRSDFQNQLDDFGPRRQVVMAASTHAGEEKMLGAALLRSKRNLLYVVVPRHAERRAEVTKDLESLGFEVVLRSRYHKPANPQKACLVVDTTGELRDWTAHADVLAVGKSWIGEGGQNPAESIIAGVPVICGPSMGNFEPLITMLREAGGVKMLASEALDAESISAAIESLLSEPAEAKVMTEAARLVLATHHGAVTKTIDCLKNKEGE